MTEATMVSRAELMELRSVLGPQTVTAARALVDRLLNRIVPKLHVAREEKSLGTWAVSCTCGWVHEDLWMGTHKEAMKAFAKHRRSFR